VIEAGAYQDLRPYLFSIAYRMLGRASEAEDVLQDAWLRASAAATDDVRSPRAWLATIVTRLCLDRLKSAREARESYVGQWLPEPVPTDALPDLEASTLRRESVTLAFLVLLEVLTPAERAAFLLREVFDYDYADIAGILEMSEPACRQLVHRAKQRIAERRPRFEASPERRREIVGRFLRATEQGDLSALTALLARDVVFEADSGGKVAAARRPVHGPDAVGRLIAGLARKIQGGAAGPGPWTFALHDVNDEPALAVFQGGLLDLVMVFTVGEAGIASIRVVRNPDKLAWIAARLPG
jgi:RNA polymerase sigma-70 factor (ECF subfamily)